MTSPERPSDGPMGLGTFKPLGDILVDQGYVDQADVDEALATQRSGGDRLETILLASGKVSPEQLAIAIATQIGAEFIQDDTVEVDPEAVALVTEQVARRYNAVPIRLDGEHMMVVAMMDPRHVMALDDIRIYARKEIAPAVATEATLARLLDRVYGSATAPSD